MSENEKLERDIEILKNGPICMYFKNRILDEDCNWFYNNDFELININTQNWNRRNAHQKLKIALNFPNHYGENLDAFDDCLGDLYNKRYKGLILIFRNFDNFVQEDKILAEGILDIIARESRVWLLTGQKLIGLIQSNDPHLGFPELGGTRPSWNSFEWFNSDRKK